MQYKTRYEQKTEIGEIEPLCGSELGEPLLREINNAVMSIDIIQYEWTIYPFDNNNIISQITNAILGKIKSGIKTRIILSKRNYCGSLNQINQNASELLKQAGAKIININTKNFCHAKIWIIDNKIVILGSHNLSKTSFNNNVETSVIIHNTNIATKFINYFNNLK